MKEQTRFEKITDKIYSYRFWCYIGEHQWTFRYNDGEMVYLNGPSKAQMNRAHCSRCNKKFKKVEKL